MKWVQDKKRIISVLQKMREDALKGRAVSLATVSGVLSTKTNLIKYADSELRFDLITTKSFQITANLGNREPIICQPAPLCFGNSVGLRNPGIDVAIKELTALRSTFSLNALLNISLSASSSKDFIYLIKSVEHLGDIVELNFSCPHASAGFGSSIGSSVEIATDYVKEIKKAIPDSSALIFVKLTPNVDNIKEIAASLAKAGVDGFTAINTVGPSLYIEPHSKAPILQNKLGGKGGMSGEWIFERAIECVRNIREVVGEELPIIGMGGVSSGKAVASMFRAGANVVGIGSALGCVKQDDWSSYIKELKEDALLELRGESSYNAKKYIISAQRMNYTPYKILEINYIRSDVMIMKLDGKMDFMAGEFVFLWLPSIGEKPFSLCLSSPITFIIKKRGAFTKALFEKKVGELVYIRGLYGKALALPKTKEAILISGGTGIALLPSLAKSLSINNTKISIYAGSSDATMQEKEMDIEEKGNEIEELLMSYGSFKMIKDNGVVGRVLDEVEKDVIARERSMAAYIVGPMPFMQKASDILSKKGIDKSFIFLSLEPPTMCGVGLCGECSCGNRLTCQMGTFITLLELEKIGGDE